MLLPRNFLRSSITITIIVDRAETFNYQLCGSQKKNLVYLCVIRTGMLRFHSRILKLSTVSFYIHFLFLILKWMVHGSVSDISVQFSWKLMSRRQYRTHTWCTWSGPWHCMNPSNQIYCDPTYACIYKELNTVRCVRVDEKKQLGYEQPN